MTDRLREAAQAALEALDEDYRFALRDRAIEQLRAALAEPTGKDDLQVAQPVAWMSWSDGSGIGIWDNRADAVLHSASDHEVQPLYTAPRCREWQSLTDEEIADIVLNCYSANDAEFDDFKIARAVEQLLKERNHD